MITIQILRRDDHGQFQNHRKIQRNYSPRRDIYFITKLYGYGKKNSTR